MHENAIFRVHLSAFCCWRQSNPKICISEYAGDFCCKRVRWDQTFKHCKMLKRLTNFEIGSKKKIKTFAARKWLFENELNEECVDRVVIVWWRNRECCDEFQDDFQYETETNCLDELIPFYETKKKYFQSREFRYFSSEIFSSHL